MKGVIIELKDQYTYVLLKNAKIKRIKREYYHEIGQEININKITIHHIIPVFMVTCLVIVAVIFNPLQKNTVQALSYISLSVNPGLVFKVDHQQRIIAVSYTNQDGNELTKKVDFVNKNLDDSVILFIDYCFENGYFQNNNRIDINVISDDLSQIESLEKQINQTVNDYLDKHQYKITISLDEVSSSQHSDAQSLGIPNSKIKLIDLILSYYPELNKEELAKESVDDLIDYLEDQGYDEDILDKMEEHLEDEDDEDDEDEDDEDEDDD